MSDSMPSDCTSSSSDSTNESTDKSTDHLSEPSSERHSHESSDGFDESLPNLEYYNNNSDVENMDEELSEISPIDNHVSGTPFLIRHIYFTDTVDTAEERNQFISRFESRYGTTHPVFYRGSYNQALDEAKREPQVFIGLSPLRTTRRHRRLLSNSSYKWSFRWFSRWKQFTLLERFRHICWRLSSVATVAGKHLPLFGVNCGQTEPNGCRPKVRRKDIHWDSFNWIEA